MEKQGLNLHLPEANLKEDKLLDKLGFYDKADKDSMKLAEWMRSDPYYKKEQSLNTSPYENRDNHPEQKIMEKLSLLEKEMNKPAVPKTEWTDEVDRLENLMQQMSKPDIEDPEMKQLEGTLDKILEIQHPERVKEKLPKKQQPIFSVSKQSNGDTAVNGFYGISHEKIKGDPNAIEAVVHENQTLVNGAVIKLRLLNDIFIKDQKIPKDNFVFGIANLNDERLHIEIQSIHSQHNLFNVKLEVFDMDGLPGIYIPGAITRDVAKQSADNSLQLMELSSTDPSLKAQATAAGIGAAKNLLSKKVKLVKVMVKAGYKVLLKDKNNQP